MGVGLLSIASFLPKQRSVFMLNMGIAVCLMFVFALFQGITVLHLKQQFHISNDISYELVGTFLALVYLSSTLAGLLTKRFLSTKQGLLLGLLLYAIGLFVASIPVFHIFLLGLAILALGYGFLYTNNFYLLGHLFKVDNPKRESAFTLAYMGFNIGALLGFMLGGYALDKALYQPILIGAGLVFLGFVFLLFRFKDIETVLEVKPAQGNTSFVFVVSVILFALVYWVFLLFARQAEPLLSLGCVLLLLFVFVLAARERQANPQSARNLVELGLLIFISVLYWMVYRLQDNLMISFFQQHVRREFFGHIISTPTLLAVNPAVILTMSPLVSWLWLKFGHKVSCPSYKIIFGLGVSALSFLFLLLGLRTGIPMALGYVLSFLAVAALSEIVIGPGVISMVGQLVSEKYQVMLLGLAQLSISLASLLSGEMSVQLNQRFLAHTASLEQGYTHIFTILLGILLFGVLLGFWVRRRYRY